MVSSEQLNPVDLRKTGRYSFTANVMVAVAEAGDSFWGSSRDVSMGGMFIATAERVPLGATLTADVYPEVVPPMRVRARVVHVREGEGFGCIFTRLSQPAEIRLNRWLGRCGGLSPVSGTITSN